ncbi:hypothetical protein [Sphingorhabdus sp.]|uniref:hypothetical protein n=1 Tax=Sphingorhabdus sp. TaxID=1902408 RepID=UPI0037C85598
MGELAIIMATAAAAINKIPPAASPDKNARKAEVLAYCSLFPIMAIPYGESVKKWQVKAKKYSNCLALASYLCL